jgi:hypothetical protein
VLGNHRPRPLNVRYLRAARSRYSCRLRRAPKAGARPGFPSATAAAGSEPTTTPLFHRKAPGALTPTRAEVAKSLSASTDWARQRDLPDPVAHKDFIAASGLFDDRLHERIRQGRFPLGADKFSLPKENGGVRQMLWMDPFDDIALRVPVGRAGAAMQRACSSSVFSYRLTSVGPGWRTLDHRQANALRRAEGLALLHDPKCGAMGTLDVTSRQGRTKRPQDPFGHPCEIGRPLIKRPSVHARA